MTKLFNDIIFGPVHSRRLGISLGVNLLPSYSKICNFDCIYCECGWNDDNRGDSGFNSYEDVSSALEERLCEMKIANQLPDVITFAGNGEPTLNPQFEEIISQTIALRDRYAPQAKISVLSNATMLDRESVVRGLRRVDNNILKLDSAVDSTLRLMNNPAQSSYSAKKIIEQMKLFDGELIVQTMFLRGQINGTHIDNTTSTEVEMWIEALREIKPRQVMVYSIDRDTPCKTIEKVGKEELLQIAQRVEAAGFKCSVA